MAKSRNPVDEFIARLPTEQQVIADSLRDIVRTTAPALKETVKWGYPCYVGAGNVCSIMPYPYSGPHCLDQKTPRHPI